MKKIVGIIAALAMAGAVFAVDFSAGFQLKADLFHYDGATEGVSAMKLWNENTKDDKPFIFSLNSDRVGATFKFYDGAKGKLGSALESHAYNIWFKPFDAVKIDLGSQDIALNKEHVTWWKGNIIGGKMTSFFDTSWGSGIGDWGYKATFNSDGFTVAAALLSADNTAWMSKAKDGDVAIGETVLYAGYAADFGNVNFVLDAKNTFKNLKIAAGYNGSFGDVSIFTDVMFWKWEDKQNILSVDFDARTSIDSIGLEAYFNWGAPLKDMSSDNMRLACYAKASYGIAGGSLFLKFEDDNLMAKKFAADFTFGYDGNLGAMSYEVAAAINVANKTSFSIPCYFRIGF